MVTSQNLTFHVQITPQKIPSLYDGQKLKYSQFSPISNYPQPGVWYLETAHHSLIISANNQPRKLVLFFLSCIRWSSTHDHQ